MIKKMMFYLLMIGLTFYSCTSTKPMAKQPSKYRLVWTDDPTTTVTIGWDQGQVENPVVYYGKEDFGQEWQKYPEGQVPTRIVADYRGMNNHFVKLHNLEPDQNYYFVIKDNEYTSDRFWFKTAPDKPKAFTFIAGGDTKSSDPPLTAGRFSNRMVAKLRPLFVIFNGDFCSGRGVDDEDWQQWLNDWTFLTTTDDGRIIPIIPVHGNHEDGDYTF
jgi:phosphodiesterase/alkaline phosphatase D-like protein